MQMNSEPLTNQNKTKWKSILIAVAVIVVAACIIGLVVYNNLADSGYFLRRSIAAESENFTVNGAMMTYFFYSNYNQYASTMAEYMGLNTSVSLKAQESGLDESGSTWFDYFAYMAENYVGELLALCECAREAGMSLTDEDQTYIDSSVASLSDMAASYGYTVDTYLMAAFGSGVKEKDVRDCMELTTLAAKYYDEFNDSLSYTEEQYNEYYEANKTAYLTVDLVTCTVKQDDFIEKDENGNPIGNITEAGVLAQEYANTMASCSTVEEFNAAVLAYNTDIAGRSAEEANAILAANTMEGMTASAGNTASDWAFSAATGETTVVSGTGGSSYDVYYLTKAAYRDDSPTRSVRHLLLTTETYGDNAESTAQAIYDELKNIDFDLNTFASLCMVYSEDPGSQATGGLYENVSQGEMVEAFDTWLFDSKRKEGDTGIVSTEYGYHIMYYVGEGDPAWKVAADAALRSEDYSELITSNTDGITFNQEVVYSINA